MRSDDGAGTLVGDLRAHCLTDFARDAARLRLVDAITRDVHATEAWQIGLPVLVGAARDGVVGAHDLHAISTDEVAAATGLARWHASREVDAAARLCGPLVLTLAALEAGRIDGVRARVLARETEGLPQDLAWQVEAEVLDALPTVPLQGNGPVGPWDGPQPKAFTSRVRKAVARVRTDQEEQVRRDVRERTGTWVEVDPGNPAVATLTVTGPTEQVVAIANAVQGAAHGLSTEELGDRTLGMAEVDALEAAVLGDQPTRAGVRRELGVVLHADTLLGDGDAADAPGEIRGVGAPVHCTAATARVAAQELLDRGASTGVLLTDHTGHLSRLVRVGAAPETGWTRTSLVAATREAVRDAARHATDSYTPTVEIDQTVRARDPVCTFPGCGVPSSRCDLDHQVPHPRGTTSVQNLSPRSRRCHRWKTAGLWRVRTRLDPAGHVVAHHWTSPLGTHQVVEVERLPGVVATCS
ncbi:HNH endonuclease signature motif containing protein [Angustibacter speluncae]